MDVTGLLINISAIICFLFYGQDETAKGCIASLAKCLVLLFVL
jgi:hypothetical protein